MPPAAPKPLGADKSGSHFRAEPYGFFRHRCERTVARSWSFLRASSDHSQKPLVWSTSYHDLRDRARAEGPRESNSDRSREIGSRESSPGEIDSGQTRPAARTVDQIDHLRRSTSRRS